MERGFRDIKHSTAGERLYAEVSLIGGDVSARHRLRDCGEVQVTGREEFGLYLEGATTVFSFLRIMKIAQGIYGQTPEAADRLQRLRIALGSWFGWLRRERIDRLMRLVDSAQQESHRSIPTSIKQDVLGSSRVHRCCFCGKTMRRIGSHDLKDDDGERGSLEHIWPSSLGGDSIEVNLVPACQKCNASKDDVFAWEHSLVHDHMYPAGFGASAYLPRVRKRYLTLLHRRAVLTLAMRDRMTLKGALLKVGPYCALGAIDSNDTWDFFNLQNHYDNCEKLW